MASERQIEANRRNAALSTGPKTAEGRAESARNATVHGLAGDAPPMNRRGSAAYQERRAAWHEKFRPRDDFEAFLVDVAVSASVRVDQCRAELETVDAEIALRASHEDVWAIDRRVEAAELAERLPKSPAVVSRKLAATARGIDLLLERWRYLRERLDAESAWTAEQTSLALDLLGVARDRRDGVTPLTPPPGRPSLAHLRDLASAEIARLGQIRPGGMDALDVAGRDDARLGLTVLRTKQAALLLRYERDALRRLREALGALLPDSDPEAVGPPTPAVAPAVEPPAPSPSPAPAPPAPEPRRVPPPAAAAPTRRIAYLPITVGRPPDCDEGARRDGADVLDDRHLAAPPRRGRIRSTDVILA